MKRQIRGNGHHRQSIARCALILAALAATTRCSRSGDRVANPTQPAGTGDWFAERAIETGLTFVHVNGMSGGLYDPEVIGPGVALLDYDNDGDLDVFVIQGGMLGSGTSSSQVPAARGGALKSRLFRNDLEIRADGTRAHHFTDVTDQSGIVAGGYGMGAATGDFDNDGCVDLYLTKFGENQLYHNNCDGTFTDVTRTSGTSDKGWSVSATFVDGDRDGWLDLFVGHYLAYSTDRHVKCFSVSGIPDYCNPGVHPPQPNRFFHNNGDGTFTDRSVQSGLAAEFGGALGVIAADLNGDGWPDLYVANDGRPNQLWINQRNSQFKNVGLVAGAALSAEGSAKASMGIDVGDFDNDGDEDLVITELSGQGSELYVNDGSARFEDDSARTGLRAATLRYTGFGTAWLDFDNDGWLDILTVNGLVLHDPERMTEPFALGQRMQLFRHVNDRFEDVTDRAGRVFATELVGRGAAFGDIDNDGDIDVVVAADNGRTLLLINQVGNRNHWVGLRLVGATVARDMVGARVGLVLSDGSTRWRRARADGSFASANDPRVVFGLGASSKPPRSVQVHWPDGRQDTWSSADLDRYATLKEGTGK